MTTADWRTYFVRIRGQQEARRVYAPTLADACKIVRADAPDATLDCLGSVAGNQEEPEPWLCAACGGPVVALGALGAREHGRCRNCGIDQSRKDDAK